MRHDLEHARKERDRLAKSYHERLIQKERIRRGVRYSVISWAVLTLSGLLGFYMGAQWESPGNRWIFGLGSGICAFMVYETTLGRWLLRRSTTEYIRQQYKIK